ncbi:MAG TPA: hypothetical protein VGT03_10570 [Candidatus Acidoferrales bacterium]|nr:hypothetical protein [Candidatus Acidoferrales bacterium]
MMIVTAWKNKAGGTKMICNRMREAGQKLRNAQSAGNQAEAQKIHIQVMDHEIWHMLGAPGDCRTDRERVYENLFG